MRIGTARVLSEPGRAAHTEISSSGLSSKAQSELAAAMLLRPAPAYIYITHIPLFL
jgi:hypothetical protein